MADVHDPEATEVDRAEGSVRPTRAPEELIGTIFDGRFEIQSVIGQGGAGTVYRALQQSLGRLVALKVSWLDGDHSGDEAARFLREASLAGGLQHPNVVTVHDFGRTEDGACYMVMELLAGVSLRNLMGSVPMEPGRALALFDQVLQGLRHAHQAGLVHRDMKPGNVQVVRTDDQQERIKILDFGLVRRFHDEGEGLQDATFVGTPHYASPEQVRGVQADSRADLYSVGVMLYRALTGSLPFAGATPRAIAVAHVRRPYPPMRRRAPGVDVDEALESLVRKAMQKDPAHRFQDARSMQLALRAWCDDHLSGVALPSLAPSTQSMELDGVIEPRSRVPLALGGLGLLAVLGAWWKMESDRSPETGGDLIAESVLEEARASEAAGETVILDPEGLHRVRVRIQTEPPGAEVEFGGQMIGRTPLDQELQVRASEGAQVRTFHLSLDGYMPGQLDLDLSVASVLGSITLEEMAAPDPVVIRREAIAPVPEPAQAVQREDGPTQRVDGVQFTAAEAEAVVELANRAELSEFHALGIRTQQANAVIRSREYFSVIELGEAPGVGEKTLLRLREGVE